MAVNLDIFNSMMHGKHPAYIFVRRALVQHWDQPPTGKGMIVASSHQAAKILAAKLSRKHGARVSPAKIGSAKGETLAGQVEESIRSQGAAGVYVTDDGETFNFFKWQND